MMDLIDRLRDLAARVKPQLERLGTEEATKTALVLPFLNALGFDVFNPLEVVPEFTADVGIKKGEKVDYAMMIGGKPAMLIEAKHCCMDLDKAHASQLYRYFSVTPARIGILTNGVEYRFYSDLEEPNKMDSRAFFEFDIFDLEERHIEVLKQFRRDHFDAETVLSNANDLKYRRGIKRLFNEEWANPSEDFVRVFASRIYDGRMTQNAKEQFSAIVKTAFHEFVQDRVSQRLQMALERSKAESAEESSENEVLTSADDKSVETTDLEMEGFNIVRAIVAEVVPLDRVFIRDTMSYCGVLLDDNNRKPICRLHFNGRKLSIGTFDDKKNETRHSIERTSDIYKHAKALRDVVKQYDAAS
ncbi:MAG: type I restriction endonuclease [Phycisphaerales bacterium JB065]